MNFYGLDCFLCQFVQAKIKQTKILITIKFVYSKKATKFCKISTLLLSTVHTDKSKVEI